ncbi:uncharacterized protein CELE_F28C6.10 [Caenorhabditis elegans]|uniref:Secreted protein n=1 Tax=Caenorhabditis elegans TaxID=6239 RepID=Q93621_CAEEL|nr:Secreted protein [Caenorhabditis elegans]CAA92676.1 Secreted protein [Caenorhabditis elegans]|eukprot:NP_495827.1 Uncharacterized protein CELE_F28C6.10 [Caenorhabditis elegans]
MMTGRGFIFTVIMGLLLAVSTVTCADAVETEGSIVSGSEDVKVSLESKSTVAPTSSVTQKSSNSTESPETDSTEKGDDEKPITEQIRTYIEDSVKSVKHAISKIGKFVGELFEPSNSTVPSNRSTTVPVASTVIPSVVSSLPNDKDQK